MPNSLTTALAPLLGVLRATLGADAAIAFHWLDDRTAAVDAGWPDDGAAPAPRTFTLRRDAVHAAGGVLLEAESPRRLVSSAVLHALPAAPRAVAVVAGDDGRRATERDGPTCGVLLVWHAAPPDAAATAAFAERAAMLRAAIGAALGQRIAAAAYDRLARRFEAVMATVPQAVVLVDDAGSGLVNAAAGRLLDAPAGAMDAARLAERMTALRTQAANAPELETTARRLVADPDAQLDHWLWRFDAMPARPGGRTLRVTTVPVHDGPARGRLWTFDDVTRETAAEEELERQRAFLAAVLESLSDGVVACDADGRLTLFNAATRAFHGLDAEHVPPEQWATRYALFRADGVTPLSADAVPLARAFRGEEVRDADMVIAPAGGPARTIRASGRPILGAGGAQLGAVVAMRDVTEQVRAQQALAASEARFRDLLATLPLVVYEVDPRPPYAPRYVSPGIGALGYSREAWLAAPDTWLRALHPDDRARVLAETEAALAAGRAVEYEYRVVGPDGAVRWVHDRGEFVGDGDGVVWRGIMLDVTARREAERALRASEAAVRRSEARFRGALDAMLDAFVVVHPVRDAAGRIEDFTVVEANAAAATLSQAALDDLVGLAVGELIPVARGSSLFDVWRRVLETGERYDGEYETRDPRYAGAWLRMQVVPVGEGLAVTARDVTETKRAEATLRELAVRDELTGLLNRRGFRQLAEQELRVARREGRRDAVLALDLNGFKRINDTHGHAAGDDALRAVAEVLRATLRETDVIARLGGDEFVVYAPMLPGAHDAPDAPDGRDARPVAARLQRALALANAAAAAAGRPFAIEAGIGVAEAEDGDDLDALLARADAALYAAKPSRAPARAPARR